MPMDMYTYDNYLSTLCKLAKASRYLEYNTEFYTKLDIISTFYLEPRTISLACSDPRVLTILKHVGSAKEAMEAIESTKGKLTENIRAICASIRKYAEELWTRAKARIDNFRKRVKLDETAIRDAKENPNLKAQATEMIHGPTDLANALRVCDEVRGHLPKYLTLVKVNQSPPTEQVQVEGIGYTSSIATTYIPGMEADAPTPAAPAITTQRPAKPNQRSTQDRTLEREIRGRMNMVKGIIKRNQAAVRLGSLSKEGCIALVRLSDQAAKAIDSQQATLRSLQAAATTIGAANSSTDPRVHNLALVNALVVDLVKSYDKVMTVAYKEALQYIEKCCDRPDGAQRENTIDQLTQDIADGKVVA